MLAYLAWDFLMMLRIFWPMNVRGATVLFKAENIIPWGTCASLSYAENKIVA